MAPVVSILSITFNQKKYIRQTLDSFLMQKTNFPFEILIHDDASTDGTTEILEEYAEKHPDIFRLYLEEDNQYSRANFDFIRDLYVNAKGKYIAFCEGDDYWIDENKLQRQVDLMEEHPEFALCFHPVKVVVESEADGKDVVYPARNSGFDVKSLLKENFIQTNSVLYRKYNYEHIAMDVMPGDWFMHLYHAQFGQIGFINITMSVYRKNASGVWWESETNPDLIWKKHSISQVRLFTETLNFFKHNAEHANIIKDNITQSLRNIARIDAADKTHLVEDFLKTFSENDNLVSDTIVALISEDEKIKSYQQYQISELTAENTELRDQIERIKSTRYYKLFKKRIGK